MGKNSLLRVLRVSVVKTLLNSEIDKEEMK